MTVEVSPSFGTNIAWHRASLDQNILNDLKRKSDAKGFIYTLAHLGLLLITGCASYLSYMSSHWILFLCSLFLHGTCYGFLGWAGAGHELVHYTVFKTKIYNKFFLHLFAFLTWNNPVYFQLSHIKHHKLTVYDGLDQEVKLPQNFNFMTWVWGLTFDVPGLVRAIKFNIENSFGFIRGEWGNLLFPLDDELGRNKVFFWARINVIGHGVLIAIFLYYGQWVFLFLISFAPFVATWLNKLLSLSQHMGMKNNVSDFRENSRTVLINPFFEFLYWKMNYHIEHHMYPNVPFYNLPRLRAHISYDLPLATKGCLELWRELSACNNRSLAG